MANVCAMVTSFFAPQIVYSKIVDWRMPFILMGVVSLLATILAFFLPETAGIKLPDTVEEAEVLFQRKSFLMKRSDKIPPAKLGMSTLDKETDGHDNQSYL